MANSVKGAAETFGSAQAPAQHTPELLWSSGKCPKTRVVDAHGLVGGCHVGVARGNAAHAVDDMGWQHQHAAYVRTLAENGFIRSMSRKGNCADNEAAVQIFGHMMNEFFRGRDTQVMCDAPKS